MKIEIEEDVTAIDNDDTQQEADYIISEHIIECFNIDNSDEENSGLPPQIY